MYIDNQQIELFHGFFIGCAVLAADRQELLEGLRGITSARRAFGEIFLFAAGNRFLLAPRLAAGGAEAASAILRSVLAETLLAVLVLVVVAALGVLEPPNAA